METTPGKLRVETDPANELEAEIELLKRIGQGRPRSFEELYDRFSGVLFSTAYRMLKNQEAAEDVLQDVFIQIWNKAPLYNPTRGQADDLGGNAHAQQGD